MRIWFWFNDEQWAMIEPHLPTNQPRPRRKDDRRILSGIMHVLKVGCRWIDCPKEYVPPRRSTIVSPAGASAGIWQRVFETVAVPSGPPGQLALDSSHVKAHRCASGGKGGPNLRQSGSRK